MGYYTDFTLSYEPLGKEQLHPQCEHGVPENAAFCPTCGRQVKTISVEQDIEEWLEQHPDYEYEEPWKWYGHNKDMKELSLLFPGYVFKLHGEGEDGEDLWDKYYVDGKEQVCNAIITYPPFDPEKLE